MGLIIKPDGSMYEEETDEAVPVPKLDQEYLDKIYTAMKEQIDNPIDAGDTWKVVAYNKDKFSGEEIVLAEMFFDRRDKVTNRREAIDYMINNFSSGLPDDVKIEASKV